MLQVRLTAETVDLAAGAKAVCVFVNDELNKGVIERLAQLGVGTIALRCAGYVAGSSGPTSFVIPYWLY